MAIIEYRFQRARTDAFLSLVACCRGRPVSRARAAEIRRQFDREGFFHQEDRNRHRNFIALRRGRTVGHVTAFLSPSLRDDYEQPVGGIGFFECEKDYAVAHDLLQAALGWLREEAGVTRIWGPIHFDIWHGYRFKTDGFRALSFDREPDNPAYYPIFFERSGFQQSRSWTSLIIERSSETLESLARSHSMEDTVREAGYRFEPISSPADLANLYDLLSQSFRDLTAYSQMPFEEFRRWFSERFLDRRIVYLVRDSENTPAAFALAYPDTTSEAIQAGGRAVFYMIGTRESDSQALPALAPSLAAQLIGACFDGDYREVVLALMSKASRAQGPIAQQLAKASCDYALYERRA